MRIIVGSVVRPLPTRPPDVHRVRAGPTGEPSIDPIGPSVRGHQPAVVVSSGGVAVGGFPPTVPDTLLDPVGYEVTTKCGDDPAAPHTELLVGLGLDGSNGGGWQGVDVTSMARATTRILHINWGLLICGPLVADRCMGEPFPTVAPSGS